MRLNGWQRIGIVASVAWAIGVYVVYLVFGPEDWFSKYPPDPDSYWLKYPLSLRSHWVAPPLCPSPWAGSWSMSLCTSCDG